MAAHNHVLIGEFCSGNHTNYSMVWDRSHAEMVANIELKEKALTFLGHLLNNGKLMLIELDIGHHRQVLESEIHVVFSVVKRYNGICGRLYNAEDSCLNHFLVEKGGLILKRK